MRRPLEALQRRMSLSPLSFVMAMAMILPGSAVGASEAGNAAGAIGNSSPATGTVRHVRPDETWEVKDGRFFVNDRWVFLKTGKLLRPFEKEDALPSVIADIDVLIDRLNYNHFSINIYPDQFDADADGRIDPARKKAYANVGRILDHCWNRGVFCSLSFETYNVGGGGTPAALFEKRPGIVAINALGTPARDVEYTENGKLIPSIFHPAYLQWSRGFIRNFLQGLGRQRADRLLYVETTVEPQYLGQCSFGDKDPRRAFMDFSEAARKAFGQWQSSLPKDDPHRRDLRWPTTQIERDRLLGNRLFNDFRGYSLGRWVSGDIEAIRSVATGVYVAVDYNGRFDDPHDLRVGSHDAFLTAIEGANIIQIAPHPPCWSTLSWDDVIRVNQRAHKHWAISEHMTATGTFPQDDAVMTEFLDNTLSRGTRWGWDLVNAGNQHAANAFDLYDQDWTSKTLDIIEEGNWPKWLKKIGAPPFVPRPRDPVGKTGNS